MTIDLHRRLLADWFYTTCERQDISFTSHGSSGDVINFQSSLGKIEAKYIAEYPYLQFTCDGIELKEDINTIVRTAIKHVERVDLEGRVWYSTTFVEPDRQIASFSTLSSVFGLISDRPNFTSQVCIDKIAIIDARTEIREIDATLSYPKLVITVHIAVPGPDPGFFAEV